MTQIQNAISRLLKLAAQTQINTSRLENAGVRIDDYASHSETLYNTALDLYGVPADTTAKHQAGQTVFCRDWFSEVWFQHIPETAHHMTSNAIDAAVELVMAAWESELTNLQRHYWN